MQILPTSYSRNVLDQKSKYWERLFFSNSQDHDWTFRLHDYFTETKLLFINLEIWATSMNVAVIITMCSKARDLHMINSV